VRIEEAANVAFDNFRLGGSKWFALSALNSEQIAVRNCYFHDNMASGIYMLDCNDVYVGYNEVVRSCAYPERVNKGTHGTQECISIVNCDGFEVTYNRVHEPSIYGEAEAGGAGSGGEGIDAKEHSKNGSIHHNHVYNLVRGSIYCDAWAAKDYGNIDVYNNVIHNCTGGLGVAAEGGGTAKDIRIFNNLVFNVRYSGVGIASWGPNGDKKQIKIYSNTIYGCNGGGIRLGDERNSDIEVFNNISYKNSRDDYNPGAALNVKAEGNLIGVDPKFADIARTYFWPGAGSSAVDAAVDYRKGRYDLNDRPRVAGKGMDVGAFERQE
jgi:hypothetical protein